MNQPCIGTRISVSGQTATVRYVGEVSDTTGVWLGVEWDDPQRGKHDGTKDGKTYFTCRVAKSGSFIRPSPAICLGVSFLEALASKYIEVPHGLATQEKFLLGSSKGAIEIEAVGLDKIRGKISNLHNLREASLDGENVARGDPLGSVRDTCPNLRGLDLSASLIPDWETVALIVNELVFLERLALNRNRLKIFADFTLLSSNFPKIVDLQLNGTLISWPEVQIVLAAVPTLTALEIGHNELEDLSPSGASVPSEIGIQSINLDSNKCRDWIQIFHAMRSFRSLQCLILASNLIDVIPEFIKEHSLALIQLKRLSLAFNFLNRWSDVDSLSQWCPALETLSISGNLLNAEKNPAERYARQLVIARVPSLLVLDSVPISLKERSDCELFYLSHVAKTIATESDRRRQHPRWDVLCSSECKLWNLIPLRDASWILKCTTEHGRPDDIPELQKREDKLSNRLIRKKSSDYLNSLIPAYAHSELSLFGIQNKPTNTTSINTNSSTSRPLQVLPSMTLRILRLRVLKATKSPKHASVDLWLKMVDGSLVELNRERDGYQLEWWGLEDGSIVLFFVNDG